MKVLLVNIAFLSAAVLGTQQTLQPLPDVQITVVPKPAAFPVLKNPVRAASWGEKSAEVRVVSGSSKAATKGAGVVQAKSGWSGSQADAEGSEGSITNAQHKANQNAFKDSWGKENSAKSKKAWGDKFVINKQTASKSKSAHQGSGSSSAASTMKKASGFAQGSEGSAVDNEYAKNENNWRSTFGKQNIGNNKSLSFGQTFAVKAIGKNTAKAIGYGESTAGAKSSGEKAEFSADGKSGVQGSTTSGVNSDSWNASW